MPTSAERRLPDWQRAYPGSVLSGRLREAPEHFQVDEIADFSPTGDGEHDLLHIEKRGANTAWVARELARFARVAARDVGYCGLKDRHAVTTQWFSVRRGRAVDWREVDIPGVRLLESTSHRRKLRRGAHRANRFRIFVAGASGEPAALERRIDEIRKGGVPNYFGPQRFGRDGANLDLADAAFAGRRLSRSDRSHALSAARAFLFNEILEARVCAGNWNAALDGEALNLDGSNSYFLSRQEPDIEARIRRFDLHPTAALWGAGEPASTGAAGAFDREAAVRHETLARGLAAAGLRQERRATRLRVAELEFETGDDGVWVTFELRSGAFATAVLREIVAP